VLLRLPFLSLDHKMNHESITGLVEVTYMWSEHVVPVSNFRFSEALDQFVKSQTMVNHKIVPGVLTWPTTSQVIEETRTENLQVCFFFKKKDIKTCSVKWHFKKKKQPRNPIYHPPCLAVVKAKERSGVKGGLTLPSSRSYWEESRGPGLSKAEGSMSAGRSLNDTSSMHRSNASP